MKLAMLVAVPAALVLAVPASAADTTVNVRAGQEQLGLGNGYTNTSAATAQSRAVSYTANGYDSYASAHVNLATGKLGVYGRSTNTRGGPGVTRAQARFTDVLTFDIAGARADTITPISMIWTLHGKFVNNGGIPAQSSAASVIAQLLINGSSLDIGYNTNPGNTCWCQGQNFGGRYTVAYGEDRITVTGIYHLVGAQSVLNLNGNLDATTWGGIITDFGNTAGLSFKLPTNVSYTSQSGVFLTQAVPEPATWAMLIGGFGVTGGALRRRRTTLRFA